MPRGNNNRRRGSHGGRYRGGGSGHGTNHVNGRGRGRGLGYMDDLIDFPVQTWPDSINNTPNRSGYRGSGTRGTGTSSQWDSRSATPRRGGADLPRGRGRGRGDLNYQYQSPREKKGGPRGSKLPHDAPLSKLLYGERPFLKPVIFVPSVHTRILFEQEEDLLQPQVKGIADEETSHVPTADRVARIFSGGNIPPQRTSGSDNEEREEIEEIDFEDMAQMREAVDAAAVSTTREAAEEYVPGATEEQFTGFLVDRASSKSTGEVVGSLVPEECNKETGFIDSKSTLMPADPVCDQSSTQGRTVHPQTSSYVDPQPSPTIHSQDQHAPMEAVEPTCFYIDTTPTVPAPTPAYNSKDELLAIDRMTADALGEDDEIIVYVAPHPRVSQAPAPPEPPPSLPLTSVLTGTTSTFTSTMASPQIVDNHSNIGASSIPTPPTFESVSFSFTKGDSPTTTPRKQQPRTRPVFTAGERVKAKAKARKKEARATRRRLERMAMFGSFGELMSEAQLRGGEDRKHRDPRWEERRRGDSDISWGDTDEDDDGGQMGGAVQVTTELDEVVNGVGAMELDTDIDLQALKAFVKGMKANDGRHVTMDDIADEERMRLEDAQSDLGESEASDRDAEVEEGSVGDEDKLIRDEEEMMMGDPPDEAPSDSDDEDEHSEEIDQSPNTVFRARLERLRKNTREKTAVDLYPMSEEDTSDDDDFIAYAEVLLDEKGGILSSAERKARKRLFQAVHNGSFSEIEDLGPARSKKDKIPAHLQDQWDRDRAKKAEYKKARAQARLESAADPLSYKKGGKKGRKAMLAAARFDPSISIPGRVVDMVTVEQQIRRFLADIGGNSTMALPPMAKESRKQVHELAVAFNLKSASKGKGDGRYTTLTKTTRSGIRIDERKVRRILTSVNVFIQPGGGKGRNTVVMPRHRDGDEVGKAAPKIGESNIGFRMLASMGWSEGDRIGVSGGLATPLTAVIKNTKLGLGANR